MARGPFTRTWRDRLGAGLGYGDIVRSTVPEFEVSARTAERDIAAVHHWWESEAADEPPARWAGCAAS
jgi:hypothetical protein